MSLLQRPLTAYFGIPDSKSATGKAVGSASKAKRVTKAPGSKASIFGTPKSSPSVKKVVKATKSSAAKEAGANPAASTPEPSPSAKPKTNKKAKPPSSTDRKIPVAKKSKTAKNAPPGPKAKKAVSSLQSSSKKPTACVKAPPSVKKLAKTAAVLISADAPGDNVAAEPRSASTKKHAGKVKRSASADNKASTTKKTKATKAAPLAARAKQAVSSKERSVTSPPTGTRKTSSATPKVTNATIPDSTVVSDIISTPKPTSATKSKAKTAASCTTLPSAKVTASASETPSTTKKSSKNTESNPANDVSLNPSSASRSTTKATRPKPTKSKAPVAKKTKAAKKGSPALQAKKSASSKASGGKSTSRASKTVSVKPTTNSGEHQLPVSSPLVLATSTPNRTASIKLSGSVDNAIEIPMPTETKPSQCCSSAASERGVEVLHLTVAADALHHATDSTEAKVDDATPLPVARGIIASTYETSATHRADNAPAIAENVAEKIPRISAKLTLAMLKEEAVCRGLVLKHLPRTKADLLSHLSDGSIHLTGTRAWKEVEAWKAKMREEQQERANQRRQKEIESQRVLHEHDFPRIHSHPLANTMFLVMNGKARNGCCELCGRSQQIQWTCETCNFDICRFCFNENNTTPEEKVRALIEHERIIKRVEAERIMERQETQRRMTQRAKEREIEEQRMLDIANERFGMAIICPSEKNLESNGNKLKGYTVWCSVGSRWDGPPTKEFDSTWKTSADANKRARYLFFWKNIFERDPDDMWTDEESEITGLKFYSVQPDDDECWSVGVVPDLAFLHLPDASSIRHTHDREYRESYDLENIGY